MLRMWVRPFTQATIGPPRDRPGVAKKELAGLNLEILMVLAPKRVSKPLSQAVRRGRTDERRDPDSSLEGYFNSGLLLLRHGRTLNRTGDRR